jgi:hypothetical protein
MTYVTLRMPTKRMSLKTMVKLLTSVIILAGSPAVASPIAHDGFHCRISEQKAGAFSSSAIQAVHLAQGRCAALERRVSNAR